MDDLISRDALFDAFNKFCKRTCSHINKPRAVACRDCHFGKAYDLIYGMPSAHSESEWIPVTERLPEKDEYVLCTTITAKGRRSVVRGYYSGKVWV